MSIHVAPELLGRVFFVPKSIVDEHLPYVTGQQLKVLLYVLRHAGEELEVEDLAEGLRMSVADTTDAMQYWLTTGVLTKGEAAANPAKPAAPAGAPKPYVRKGNGGASPKETPKELPVIQDITPSYETVAARLQEDAALKAMFQEVQARMGRTIGYADQAKFLMMHDDYGLPPEVILTIIEYSVKKGKGTAYMCKVGKNWAEEGVCTLEDAMEKLEKIAKTDKAWTEFTALFTTNPPKQTDSRLAFLQKWRYTYGQSAELIYHAYETMVEAIDKVNFNYMDKILTRWNEEGLRTPQDVLQSERGSAPKGAKGGTSANRRGKKLPGDNHKASYDSDAYRSKAQGPIEYKPKGDR